VFYRLKRPADPASADKRLPERKRLGGISDIAEQGVDLFKRRSQEALVGDEAKRQTAVRCELLCHFALDHAFSLLNRNVQTEVVLDGLNPRRTAQSSTREHRLKVIVKAGDVQSDRHVEFAFQRPDAQRGSLDASCGRNFEAHPSLLTRELKFHRALTVSSFAAVGLVLFRPTTAVWSKTAMPRPEWCAPPLATS
jgi:hypothetical protein